ncbi:hypothetical protein THRCLA_10087, partial [Thraustotheca clavata]
MRKEELLTKWEQVRADLSKQKLVSVDSPGVVDALELLTYIEEKIAQVFPIDYQPSAAIKERVKAGAKASTEMVTLNVGGTLFVTTRSNLIRDAGSYFHTMLTSALCQPNENGEYFIDLEPTYFDRIMKYLRTGKMHFDGLQANEVQFVPTAWNPLNCGPSLQLLQKNLVVVQKGLGWASVLAAMPLPCFTVTVMAHHHVDIGFTTLKEFEPNKGHVFPPGWFFGCEKGFAYSNNERKYYKKQKGKLNVTVMYSQMSNEISFQVNGEILFEPFRDVQVNEQLYPVVRLGERDAQVEMISVKHYHLPYLWTDKFYAIENIVLGLSYLHSFNPTIVHHGINSSNVLIDPIKGKKLGDISTPQEDDVLSEFCTHKLPNSNIVNPQSGQPYSSASILIKVSQGRLQPSFEGTDVPTCVKEI